MSQRSLCRPALGEPQIRGSHCTCDKQDIRNQRHELPSKMSPNGCIGRDAPRVRLHLWAGRRGLLVRECVRACERDELAGLLLDS